MEKTASSGGELKTEGTQAALTRGPGGAGSKYRRIMVGRRSWRAFLQYELITGLFGDWPGALGLWLRRSLYPFLFRECAGKPIIGRHVILRSPGRISLGRNVVISEGCTLDAKGENGQGILIGDNVFIGQSTIITMADGTIEIGEGTNISSFCRIGTLGHTRIGKKVLIAAYCYILGGGHDASRTDIPVIDQPNVTKGGATIGDGAWLGARVTVMDGVHVGNHAIIGAHAVVTHDIPDYAIAVGIPARVIRSRQPVPGGSGGPPAAASGAAAT